MGDVLHNHPLDGLNSCDDLLFLVSFGEHFFEDLGFQNLKDILLSITAGDKSPTLKSF